MPLNYRWALFFTALVVAAFWLAFFYVVISGRQPFSIANQDLQDIASIGDTFGVLNSLFTGLALAAIVVAIFMQAKQLDEQVETNNLYKKEVQATLENLERENAWKSVESKMHLIPLLSERYEDELMQLVKQYRVRSLEEVQIRHTYKSKSELESIYEAVDGYVRIQEQYKISITERRENIQTQHQKIVENIEEIRTKGEDAADLEASYAAQAFKLEEEARSAKSQLEQIDANIEGTAKMRAVLANLQKLNEEYELAFQKAYDMTA